MRTMKKTVAMVLVIALMAGLSTVAAFAAYPDVPSEHIYAEAINTLADFDIIKGYPDGTFQPDNAVTRAEFTSLVMRTLGLGDIVGSAESPFSDVPANHYALDNIKVAYDMGIILGMGDGTFMPDERVTYEQAVKMIVAALGFTESANQKGGYPLGYISVASEKGITDGVTVNSNSDPAVRGVIAQLLYNSLEVNMAIKNTDGSVELSNETILANRLYLNKVVGQVSGNEMTMINSANSSLRSDEITVQPAGGVDVKLKIGDFTDAPSMIGKSVVAYYRVDSTLGDNVLVSLNEQTGRNESLTINGNDIAIVDGNIITYWNNGDKKDVRDITILPGTKVIYNSQYVSYEDFINPDNHLISNNGEINLIDSDGDSNYDVAIVKGYQTYVVASIEASEKKIYNSLGGPELYVPNSDLYTVVNIIKDGNKITFNDIRKDDVLSVAKPFGTGGKTTMEIMVSSEKISGKIDETSSNRSVTINDEEYLFDLAFTQYLETNGEEDLMSLGSSGQFYLDYQGNICWIKAATVAAAQYGYLVNAAPQGSDISSDIIAFRIFSTTGFKNYTSANRVKIDTTTGLSGDEILDAWESTALETGEDLSSSARSEYPYSQPIKFTTNSRGEIDYIETAYNGGEGANGLVKADGIYSEDGLKYTRNTNNGVFGSNKVTANSNTIIFMVPEERTNEANNAYRSMKFNSLTNNLNYKIEAFDVKTANASLIIVYGESGENKLTIDSPMLMIGKISSVMSPDDNTVPVQRIEAYKVKYDGSSSGESVTVYTETATTLQGYAIGDIIRYTTVNGDKISSLVSKEFSPGSIPKLPDSEDAASYVGALRYKELDESGVDLNKNAPADQKGLHANEAEYRTGIGTVMEVNRDDNIIMISNYVSDDGLDLNSSVIPFTLTGATVMVYDGSKSDDNKISTLNTDSAIMELESGSAKIKGEADAAKVFTYSEEGVLKFVYIVKNV